MQKARKNVVANTRRRNDHNARFAAGKELYTMGSFNLDHLSDEELMKSRTGAQVKKFKVDPQRKKRALPQGSIDVAACSNPPASTDWTSNVAPIQDQGQCASCYVFTSAAAIEAAVSIKCGTPVVKLSEQQLVECMRDPTNPAVGGCATGRVEWIFTDSQTQGGIVPSSGYNPYSATDTGTCTKNLPKATNTIVDKWYSLPLYLAASQTDIYPKEDQLKCSVAMNGPHTVAFYSGYGFQHYQSGIFDDSAHECNSSFYYNSTDGYWHMYKGYNHNVLLIGYGTDIVNGASVDYWLVKNSYGIKS